MIGAAEGPFPGQVLSTMLFYDDCEYRDRRSGSAQAVFDPAGDYLGRILDGPYVLLPLDGPSSPFVEEVYLISGGAGYSGDTTDYFQAALLLTGAPATRPYVK
jgi:hypothetical protein